MQHTTQCLCAVWKYSDSFILPFSPSGAGQQCCYDKEGKLVVGPPGGGTLDKYHPKSSRFASLRHLKYDVYGWYLCCRLSKFCGVYYQKRPSDDGSRYRPPQISMNLLIINWHTILGNNSTQQGTQDLCKSARMLNEPPLGNSGGTLPLEYSIF